MSSPHVLTESLAALSSWRHGFAMQTARVAAFLRDHGFLMRRTEAAFDDIASHIEAERLTIAFVGDAGSGKSTLVNALFFGGDRRHLLPTGPRLAARCVTEILHDRHRPPGIRLLPIESRESTLPFDDIYRDASLWQSVLFEPGDGDSIRRGLTALAETRRIPIASAVAWGLHRDKPGESGMIEVPRWRHAVVNLPHPLLEAGLAIVDTPGTFSLLAEPELLRGRVASADVLILAVDAARGLTPPAQAIWRDCRGEERPGAARAAEPLRLVALTKIDLLRRDDPLDPDSVDREWLRETGALAHQVADLLRIEPRTVVPVSAQMALVGKAAARGVNDLVVKSRLYQLERMLDGLSPLRRRRELGRDAIALLTQSLDAVQQSLDQSRYESLDALRVLGEVRKKNETLSAALARESGERSVMTTRALEELQAVAPIHQKLAAELAALTDPALAQRDIDLHRHAIETSAMTADVGAIATSYFGATRERIAAVGRKVDEVAELFASVGNKLFASVGLPAYEPHPFSRQRFDTEIDKTEEAVRAAFGQSAKALIRRKAALAKRFEELVAERVLHLFAVAHRETTTWMRGLLAGIEKPIHELHERIQSRADKVAQVQTAEQELAERLADVQARLDVIKRQHTELAEVRGGLDRFAEQADESGKDD